MNAQDLRKHRASVLVLRYDNLRKKELRARVSKFLSRGEGNICDKAIDALVEVYSGERFFDDLKEIDLQRVVCRLTIYLTKAEKDVVYKAGDESDSYYYILSGSVVFEPDETQDETGNRRVLRELKSGQSFGDCAFQNDSKRRETVWAQEDCELLVISGKKFRSALLESSSNEVKDNIDCIRKNPLFTTWKDAQLLELCKSITSSKYRGNEMVCWQGSPAFSVHFIKDGACRVVKEIRRPHDIFNIDYDNSPTARRVRGENSTYVEAETLRRYSIFGARAVLELKKKSEEKDRASKQASNNRSVRVPARRRSGNLKQHYSTSLISSLKCEILSVKYMEIVRAATKTQMDIIFAFALGRQKYYTEEYVRACLMKQVKWEAKKLKVLSQFERERQNSFRNLRGSGPVAKASMIPKNARMPVPPAESQNRRQPSKGKIGSEIRDRRLTIVANSIRSVRTPVTTSKRSNQR